ncbi:hypothetical protein [Clostridium uliginosum]|uniref:Uncharacterized protein n=1 Tax=Clostridium uliginosum TaxID=119641 RepID=A0A1I1NW42_9CLOT|nr:hypothetical protein [Clostridium uliginosum]SFD01904.1 hypothetical protein SAMN05421842_11718 [Clostridium uliginosum]
MNKNKNLLKIAIFTLLIVSTAGSTFVVASSDNYLKDKVKKLTEQFNSKKSNLEKTGTYSTDTKESKEVKELGIKIADLSEQTKTEEDYKKELEDFLLGCRRGLEDTKRDQKLYYEQSTQDFIDKMEKKLADIEDEMKSNDELNKNSSESKISLSHESPSKKLLERLNDRSDVD